MKHLTRSEMKKVMGGCIVGGSLVGFSGGGKNCKVDMMICNASCYCDTFCDIPAAPEECSSAMMN